MKQILFVILCFFMLTAQAQVLKQFLIEPAPKDASIYSNSCESPSDGIIVFKSAIKNLNISLYPPNNLKNMNYNEQNNEYVLCVKATTKKFRIDIRHAEYEYIYFVQDSALASDANIYRVNPKQNDGAAKQNIGISQSNTTPTLSVLPISLSFSSHGEQLAFEISSNRNWTIDNVPKWLTVEPLSGSNNGTITLTATANTSSFTKLARLTVRGSNVRVQNINISQATTILDGIFENMILVKGGTFSMGVASDWVGSMYEVPIHKVTLSDYYMSIYEVTQAQWKAVMGLDNPSVFKGDNLPVESVSWMDVQEFIRKLNTLTGKQFRLPTEAEWEWAARGGVEGAKVQPHKYSGSDRLEEITWLDGKIHAVGTKAPNELGIYDMSGNVWEWCSDWFGRYPGNAQKNPKGPLSEDMSFNGPGGLGGRVARGSGAILYSGTGIYPVTFRHNFNPYFRSNQFIAVGFRLVCDPD